MPNTDGIMTPYEYYKHQHRCVACMRTDAFTLAGKVLCAECSEKNNERMRQTYSRDPSVKLERQKERFERLKAAGICVQCGKRPVPDAPIHSRCEYCRAKNARRRVPQKKADTATQCGLCCRCFRKLEDTDSKLCRSCLEQLAAAREKGLKTIADSEPNGFRKSIENEWNKKRKNRGDTDGTTGS